MDKTTIIQTLRDMAKHPTVTLPRDTNALKAAADLLEQADQKPAAWVETREDGSIYWGCETDTVISDDPSWLERPVPVYFAPPPRKPLTDEQIERIFVRYGGDMMNCARAIEREHGIEGDA